MQLVQLMREQDLVKEGNIRDSLGRCEEVIAAYDKTRQIDPTDQDVWFDNEITRKKMGKNH